MAFIYDVVSQAQKAGKFICDKAEDAKDYVTLEYKASSVKGKIDKQYKKLGKLIYTLSETQTEDDGQVQDMIAIIKEHINEYDEIMTEISKFKNICPECNTTCPANANFCTKCGAKLK